MARVENPTTFSEHFGIDPALDSLGVLNPTPLNQGVTALKDEPGVPTAHQVVMSRPAIMTARLAGRV